jgi:hypothetical protein
VQLQTHGSHDLQDRVEAGAAFAGKRFVEALAGQAGITRDLCHALRSSDIAEGLGNKCGIAVSVFKTRFKVGSHLLRGPEVLSDIIASGDGLPHGGHCSREATACQSGGERAEDISLLVWVLLEDLSSRMGKKITPVPRRARRRRRSSFRPQTTKPTTGS